MNLVILRSHGGAKRIGGRLVDKNLEPTTCNPIRKTEPLIHTILPELDLLEGQLIPLIKDVGLGLAPPFGAQ